MMSIYWLVGLICVYLFFYSGLSTLLWRILKNILDAF